MSAIYFDHINGISKILNDEVTKNKIYLAADLLAETIINGGCIYVAGNGGSAAVANHLVCDYLKGIQLETKLYPRVQSLSSNIELITAIANDHGYSQIFLKQIEGRIESRDLIILISSSGTSENIKNICKYLNSKKLNYVSIFGFDSSKHLNSQASIQIHINSQDYGVIEDISQIIMHLIKKLAIQKLNSNEF